MKRKSLILVSFLMMLYIVPFILAPSYASRTIPAQQTTSKEFVISANWYNADWHYRQNITITGSAGAGINYAVRIAVVHDLQMQPDFDDIVFTDDGGGNVIYHWRETYIASTSAVFWVKVEDDLQTGGLVWMYYGNSAVNDTSDGANTFLVYEDWTSESIRTAVWDILNSDGSVSYAAGGASHGTIAKFDADAGLTYRLVSDYDSTAPTAVMFRSNIEEATTVNNLVRQGSGYTSALSFALVQSSQAVGEVFFVYDDDGNPDSQAMTTAYFDTWVTFEITRDGTNAKLYADDILIETASCEPDVNTNIAVTIRVDDSEEDLYSDWVAVRKFIAVEPSVSSFGAEQTNREWNVVLDSVIVIFYLSPDETGLNMLLLFGGLILIPCSTIYLVKGGGKEMSSDKFFYFCIAFIIGWALFLGGIM